MSIWCTRDHPEFPMAPPDVPPLRGGTSRERTQIGLYYGVVQGVVRSLATVARCT